MERRLPPSNDFIRPPLFYPLKDISETAGDITPIAVNTFSDSFQFVSFRVPVRPSSSS